MADVDLARAERLLKSARDLQTAGDLAGVAGLAYQAFESAVIALSLHVDGANGGTHESRRRRAKSLLMQHRRQIDRLWETRNVDFYGNRRALEPKRNLTDVDAQEALKSVEEIIAQVKQMMVTLADSTGETVISPAKR